jgi:large subunit ribosomal protein L10
MSTHQVSSEKIQEVEELKSLIKQYKIVSMASLQKVRATQLQELKKKLGNSAHIRVTKNTIMKRVIAQCEERSELKKLEEQLSGPTIFIFTNLNPFKLAILLDKSKVKTSARAGDIASEDVIIPAGNTGMPPGPVISQLTAIGLPTRIQSGSVWINADTKVLKKGDTIDTKFAGMLSKLGIKPVETGLSLKAAYDDGLIISEEQLHIDLGGLKKSLGEASAQAFNLSLSAVYPVAENIRLLLQKAHNEAHNLAITANILTPETITDLLRKAQAETLSLMSKIPN